MEELITKIILENQKKFRKMEFIPRSICVPKTEQILIFTGPRRSGKTSLQVIQAQKIDEEDVLFIDFDDERLIELNAIGNYDIILDSYRRIYPDRSPVFFLDEVQSLKNWHLYVKRLYSDKFKIYVTGSNSNLLSKEIATYLTGRGVEIQVHPFSFSEYLALKKITLTKKDLYTGVPKILNLFDDYLIHGGFPEVITSEDKLLSIKSIFNLIFYKDLIAKYNYPEYPLKLIISKLVENLGRPFSLSKLANKINSLYPISKPTVIDYVHSLEMPFLIGTMFLYRKSFKNRESERKAYFIDNSFITLNSIEPEKGNLLENLVYVELRRKNSTIHYYRTKNGLEVDFLVENEKGKRIPVQVAYSIRDHETKSRETNSLLTAMDELGSSHGLIITYNEEEKIKSGKSSITVIPAWKWLLETGADEQHFTPNARSKPR